MQLVQLGEGRLIARDSSGDERDNPRIVRC